MKPRVVRLHPARDWYDRITCEPQKEGINMENRDAEKALTTLQGTILRLENDVRRWKDDAASWKESAMAQLDEIEFLKQARRDDTQLLANLHGEVKALANANTANLDRINTLENVLRESRDIFNAMVANA